MAETRTLLCFGDSNTHGTCPMVDLSDRQRFASHLRWPGVLASHLGSGFHVIEEGHPGRTTVHPDPIEGIHKNGAMILPALLETHRPIDLVIVMLGTNDLKARFSVTPFDIALGVEQITQTILASDTGPDGGAPQVLLLSPPPIVETGALEGMFEGGEAKSRQLAALYGDVARRNQIGFFDAGSVIQSDPSEGIHYDETQHKRLGQALKQVVSEIALRNS